MSQLSHAPLRAQVDRTGRRGALAAQGARRVWLAPHALHEAYERLLDIAAYADAEEGMRQGLEDAKQRKLRPAREFFIDFEAEHGIPR